MKNPQKTASIGTKIYIAGFIVLALFILCFITFYFLQNKLMNNDYFFNNYAKYSSLLASESDIYFITSDDGDLRVVNRIRESFPAIVGYHFFSKSESLYTIVDKPSKWPIHELSMFEKYNSFADGIVYENGDYLIYKYDVSIESINQDSIFNESDESSNTTHESIGSAFILVNRNAESIDGNQYVFIVSLFSIFFIGTWFYYSQFLKTQIIKPLQNLSKSLDTASKGIYIPTKSDFSSSEMLNISESFNQLLDQTKSKEKALTVAIDDAKNKAAEKTIFSATLSHEIRTPLNGVIGSLDLIDIQKLDKNNKEIINIVKYSADHLLNITNSSLDFSKYSLDDVEFHKSTTNLYKLLHSCLKMHKSSADKNGVVMNVNYPSNIPLHFEIDETKVQQMVSNLVGNSIKFTEKGYITIDVKCFSSSLKTCEIQISINDSGSGIATDKLVSIFEPYKQENGNTHRKIGGTGLGLSISKRLAVLMGGDLTVSSELDYGSSFTISLELETSEIYSKSQTFLTKMPDELKDSYTFFALIKDDFTEKHIKSLFDHYDVKYFNDVASFKNEIDEFTNVLITDYSSEDILSFTKEKLKIVQLNKDFFSDDFYNISFPKNKLSLDSQVLDFLTNDSNDNIIDEDYHLLSIDHREHLRTDGELSILVAEDNNVNQMVIKKLLAKCNQNNVVLAKNGQEALQRVSENHFDVIFMDCQMPIKDGFTATLEIRDMESRLQLPNIPIIALTANVESGDIAKCKEVGMTYFLSKPIRSEKVQKALICIQDNTQIDFIID